MNDWDDTPGPVVPRIPRQRKPQDDRVQCTGCPDTVPRNQIREHDGWPLCPECYATASAQYDRNLTRDLAYAL